MVGVLPAAIAANGEDRGLICPGECGPEAAWADADMPILAPASLIALANHFKGSQILSRPEPAVRMDAATNLDLADIKGQEMAKRALEVTAAGGHNMLMVGPPGSGNSMLASRLPTILPALTPAELLDVSMIQSIAGLLPQGKLSATRPFRAPHHSASMAAMVGGGLRARPGEVALSHNGILFLDELPEFSPQVLDSLRQPIESGETVISRANHRVTYPSRFQLIAAMNPCRCGHCGEPGFTCKRGPRCAADYQARISGPLLDRIDIRIEVPAVSAADLMLPAAKEGSKQAAERVARARDIQKERFSALAKDGIFTNAQCPAGMIETICQPDQEARDLLHQAANSMALSARGYHRILKVARTLADLAGRPQPGKTEIAESLSYRMTATQSLVLA